MVFVKPGRLQNIIILKISKRHLAKTISWRVIGSLDTLTLAWFISGDLNLGIQISGLEIITKMVLYYIHERVWFRSIIKESNKRHLVKTFTWRLIGTLDTIVLSWIITGNPLTGLKIGGTEIITKLLLYYGHEKFWYKINFGLDRFKKKSKIF